MPGQTIEDIARAEAAFLERVIELHPDADGKPCVVGNCQAGWAVMMLASIAPELFGPIIIAASPLSYWTGQRGFNPMRYTGGLFGGSWLTRLRATSGTGSSTALGWYKILKISILLTRYGRNRITSSRRLTPRLRTIWNSSVGGAVTSI